MDTQNKLNKIISTGLTQKEISEKTGVSQPTVSRIARGIHIDIKASTDNSISALYTDIFGTEFGKNAA